MKTLKFLFIALMAIGMASCSDKKSSNDSADDEEEQEEVVEQKGESKKDSKKDAKEKNNAKRAEREIGNWDDLLDEYEEFVEEDYTKYIKHATSGKVDMDEYQAIVDKSQEFNSKFANTESFGEMSDSQRDRYMKIAERMYKIAQEMRNK